VGLGLLLLLRTDGSVPVVAELSKASIRSSGEQVREVVVPAVELVAEASGDRLAAHLNHLRGVVTETGVLLSHHVTEVNRDGVLCIISSLKPPLPPVRSLGQLSAGLVQLLP